MAYKPYKCLSDRHYSDVINSLLNALKATYRLKKIFVFFVLLKSLNLHFVITLMFRNGILTFQKLKKNQTKSKEKIINIKECMSFFSYFLGLAIDTLFDRGGAGVHCYQF